MARAQKPCFVLLCLEALFRRRNLAYEFTWCSTLFKTFDSITSQKNWPGKKRGHRQIYFT